MLFTTLLIKKNIKFKFMIRNKIDLKVNWSYMLMDPNPFLPKDWSLDYKEANRRFRGESMSKKSYPLSNNNRGHVSN